MKFNNFNTDELSVMDRLLSVKVDLLHSDLHKTGHNKYGGYDYFELSDFTLKTLILCRKRGLAPHFHFTKRKGYLFIVDLKSGAYLWWETSLEKIKQELLPTAKPTKDIGKPMKDNQAVQTYAKRTLYLSNTI